MQAHPARWQFKVTRLGATPGTWPSFRLDGQPGTGYDSGNRFALDFLPPYSPELNLIELVWKLTRRSCLHNRYFGQLSELIEDVENQFNQWHKGNATLRRLCAKI